MKRYFINTAYIYFFFIFTFAGIKAQTIFEDSKGENYIAQYSSGIISLNLANSSIKIGTNLMPRSDFRIALDLTGKATNNIANVISSGNISPGAKLSATIGYSFEALILQEYAGNLSRTKKIGSILDPVLIQFKYLKEGNKIKLLPAPLEKICENLYDARDTLTNMLSATGFNAESNERKTYSVICNKIDSIASSLEKIITRLENKIDSGVQAAGNENADTTNVKNIELEIKGRLNNYIGDFYSQYKEYLFSKNTPVDLDWLTLRLDVGSNKYSMFSAAKIFEKQLSDTVFTYCGGFLSYQKFFPGIRFILSIGAGVSQQNNIADLDLIEYSETKTETDYTGTVIHQSKKTVPAYNGIFRSYANFSAVTGCYWKPIVKLPAAITAFAKFDNNEIAQTITFGLGGYLVNKSNSLLPLAGISVEYKVKIIEKEKNAVKDLFKVNLVMSWPLDFGFN